MMFQYVKKAAALISAAALLMAPIRAQACSAVYIGSKVSEDGTTVIARCADTHPLTTTSYLKITPAESKKGRTSEGSNGFSWELPEETYRYVSTPLPTDAENGKQRDSSAINEKGVAVTATVTGYICEAAKNADPYKEQGLTEDNIPGLLGASVSTAKDAVKLLAKIIDEKGSAESNIILIADEKECWYMEIYTGHQYAAVKLPEDCAAGIGNQFMLETLDEFKDKITSKDLESLPKKKGFAEYDDNGSLNLFDTYSGKGRFADNANLRAFRVQELLAPSAAGEYHSDEKTELLFKPDEKVSTQDVIRVFRDRMEGTEYEDEVKEGKARIIATEESYQVHVMKIHKDLPAEIAIEEWLCLSNAAYAPFVPISNAITDAADEYQYVLPEYKLDRNSAGHLYKELNALAAQNREDYGLGIEEMWQWYESVWQSEYEEALDEAADDLKKNKDSQAAKVLTDCSMKIQNQALNQTRQTTDDLIWYMMGNTSTMRYSFSSDTLELSDHPYGYNAFSPKVKVSDFAEGYGWQADEQKDEIILTDPSNKDMQIEIIPADGKRGSAGKLTVADEETDVDAVMREDGIYISFGDAKDYIWNLK